MCGIVGLRSFRGGHPDRMRELTDRMAAALVHRGPDDDGTWVDAAAGIALGFRRLAIIDLSPAGAGPMTSASGRHVIVFNGEIYNHLRLRERLESERAAPAWRGHCDTEVLLACIEAWGLARAVEESIGMFAFALWDARERTLSLVRDRAGVKPLYFTTVGDDLLFGSELKALIEHPSFERRIDPVAAAAYARLRYVPGTRSIYRGVEKVPPGTIVTVNAAGERRDHVYWNAAAVAERCAGERFTGSEDEALDALETVLSDAVGLRMIADVPLGVFLSGGVDSSLVAALMQRRQSGRIHTFTMGFEDPRLDEARFAREVAAHLGSEHEEMYVSATETLAAVAELPHIYDEPFADTSAVPTYLLSRMARRSVTVALSGDGGDELFAGYHHHFLSRRLQRRVAAVPRLLRPAAGRALQALGWRSPRAQHLGRALVANDPIASYLRSMELEGIVHSEETPRIDPARATLDDPTEAVMFIDFTRYLANDILVKVDRASMAVSLEAREPFLDHRVVELAWSLPLSMKIRDDRGKWIERQLLKRYLPTALVDREKQGFGLPIAEWLRGPLRSWAEEMLDPKHFGEDPPFDSAEIRRRWQRHLQGESHQIALWTALMFQAWKKHYRAVM